MKYISTFLFCLIYLGQQTQADNHYSNDTKNDKPTATSLSKVASTEKADKKGETKLPIQLFEIHPPKTVSAKTEKGVY